MNKQEFLLAAEVKVGGAEYTKNQRIVYSAMERGDAVTMRGTDAKQLADELSIKANPDGSYNVPKGSLKITAHAFNHDGTPNPTRTQILNEALKRSARMPGDR